MSTSPQMTMVATIYRNAQTSTDDYGHSKPADWQLVGTTICWLWISYSRLARSMEREVQADVPMLMAPLSADIKVGDKVTSVTDRRSTVLLGPSMVEAVNRQHTHVVATLKRVEV